MDEAPLSMPVLTHARAKLEAAPLRAAQLLHAIAMSLSVRALLARHGYGPEDHNEGLELLRECIGSDDVVWPEQLDLAVQDAVVEVDQWDEVGFRLIEATLGRRYPEQARFVLGGLAPSQGASAVTGVGHLLDRLDALESDPARSASRLEDKSALAALAKRGITKEERTRLRALVEKARPATSKPPLVRGVHPTDHETRLIALRAWYDEWATVARAAVTREDQLVRMGLISRPGSEPST